MAVEFQEFSVSVKSALRETAIAFLHEAAAEILSAVTRNTRVKTGQLKGSWQTKVDESALEAQIGSLLENAIWEEFGTGEYAIRGNGRKCGWYYEDEDGIGHWTHGKRPSRAFQKAFDSKKNAIIRRASQIFSEEMN